MSGEQDKSGVIEIDDDIKELKGIDVGKATVGKKRARTQERQ